MDSASFAAGLLPGDARAAPTEVGVASFPLRANGRSLTLEWQDGFVHIVFDKRSDLVLGIQAVGAGCADMAARTLRPHPTLGETLQEAALMGLSKAYNA
ncbi:hypothetical protein [Rhizobium sp. FY34]|uniref:hypothetical protein n=1 Tax=Rhizobium sp. FY34 TaxID=2562309 RepID=UPI0010BFE957|nr:hypothetical protein [Rhizobium sp. FY34]